MSDFNSRIAAQRDILMAVNALHFREELLGLSQGALDRWFSKNEINKTSQLAQLLFDAASKLFFLANKSQEQITDQYRKLSLEVDMLIKSIRYEANNIKENRTN